MKVNYRYAGSSMCTQREGHLTLGLSGELSRKEQVSFRGSLKHPLVFRDAMLMLRELVVTDDGPKKKERVEFFAWLENEINRKILEHERYLPQVREELKANMDSLSRCREEMESEIAKLIQLQTEIKQEINKTDIWHDYHKIERKFWKFLKHRDIDLWFVLDPVITVHKDQVSFEAFSVDESMYGCLSIPIDEFELLEEPSLGTTNIDFSAGLAKELERFRTYSKVELAINPNGFTVASGVLPQHVEKKIDLPESWVKGFNQVSAAANLSGLTVSLTPADMYDICSFLRRHKEKVSPRYMKWILKREQPIRILFEPFQEEITLRTVYHGKKDRKEKIWGRRRWLVLEKLLPLSKSFQIKLLGFGLPQFIVADMGSMCMTIGLTSWSANDWVKGTAFHIMSGFIGEGNYQQVYTLLKKNRCGSIDEICSQLKSSSRSETMAGIGHLFKRGEAYFDLVRQVIRFRDLFPEPIPKHFYQTTDLEYKVKALKEEGLADFRMRMLRNGDYVFHNLATMIRIDQDGQIVELSCDCREFKKGPRNFSSPCPHILTLYLTAARFTQLELNYEKEYKINDIMEILL